MEDIKNKLERILKKYSVGFEAKKYSDNFDDIDVLMDVFGITQELKSENKQYWGRELGKCWENLLRDLFEATCKDFAPPKRFGADEPADFFVGKDAIDTKYRVGSGDSGTLKKFESYGKLLQKEGYNPVFLFLRSDNLPAALSKMDAGGWKRYTDAETFNYILEKTSFDLKTWLIQLKETKKFEINRA